VRSSQAVSGAAIAQQQVAFEKLSCLSDFYPGPLAFDQSTPAVASKLAADQSDASDAVRRVCGSSWPAVRRIFPELLGSTDISVLKPTIKETFGLDDRGYAALVNAFTFCYAGPTL